MMQRPNLSLDKLLSSTTINLKFNHIPALNINLEFVDPYSIFHYCIDLYERLDGSKYYIFNKLENCTMYIMNCNKEIYNILKEYVTMDDNIEIWQFLNNTYEFVPTLYRHFRWYQGEILIEELL